VRVVEGEGVGRVVGDEGRVGELERERRAIQQAVSLTSS
jgi:hypothetical protein